MLSEVDRAVVSVTGLWIMSLVSAIPEDVEANETGAQSCGNEVGLRILLFQKSRNIVMMEVPWTDT